jgi:hypothetical protein
MSKSLKQLHFAQAKTRYIPLQTGLRFHSRGYEQPPHQGAHGIINSKRLAGDRCTSSNNDLRLGRLDSSSDGPRANATAEGPSFTSLAEDENQPLKPKSRRPGAQVAPTVSSAETTAGARGSLAYGDHHLSTDDGGHLPTNTAPANNDRPKAHRQVLSPVLAEAVPEHKYRPRGVRRVERPPGAADSAGRTWTWPARAWHDRRPGGGRKAAP